MKLGAENRNKAIAAAVLAGIAAVLVIRMFLGGAVPASAPSAAPARQAPPARGPRAARGARIAAISPLDPRLRLDLLKNAENTEYKGSGRDIFLAQAAPPPIPKPIVSPVTAKNHAPTPPVNPGPPPPPPINLKFFGFANRPGEPTKVFLSEGDHVFVASQGQIVKGRYKIVRISPTSVDIEDVLNNNKQTIPLTQG